MLWYGAASLTTPFTDHEYDDRDYALDMKSEVITEDDDEDD